MSTQHVFVRLMGELEKCLEASGIGGTMLMDISKAHDCLLHDTYEPLRSV